VVDPSGNYTLTPTLALPDGDNTLNVVLTDSAGNDSAPVSTTFTIDTTAPVAPVAPDLQSGSDTGDSDTDDTTSDTTPTFDVVCTEIGSTITLYSSGSTIGTHTCTTVGTETVTPSPALADGVYNVAYTETDPAGNESPLSPDLTVTADTTAPAAPIIDNPTSGLVTNDNTPIINGTAEPNSTITLTDASGTVIGTTTTDSTGDWTFTPTTPFADGGHVINATATDSAGNQSPVATTTFIVDTLAPTPLVLNTPIDGSITNDNTPDITGTGEPGTVFEITDGNGALVGT
jgi:large repetitive protein